MPYVSTNEGEVSELKNIVKKLESLDTVIPENITSYEDFLRLFQFPHDKYILALRSTLDKPKIYYKRGPQDVRTNPYSTKILSLMRSNMDIQYVLDAFGAATYVVNYLNKSR